MTNFDNFCNNDKCKTRETFGYCGFISNSMRCPWQDDKMFDNDEKEESSNG